MESWNLDKSSWNVNLLQLLEMRTKRLTQEMAMWTVVLWKGICWSKVISQETNLPSGLKGPLLGIHSIQSILFLYQHLYILMLQLYSD